MRSYLPLAVFAVVGATTMSAQHSDDYALRFNGSTDFVAMPQSASVMNSFTMELWARPSVAHEIDNETLAGYAGVYGQRYAIYPSHGTHCWGPQHAGAGISVGTNGVSVYEHAGDYMPAVLVHRQPIDGWTHIAVVYRERRPFLYINGELVRVGRVSPYTFVHPSTGDQHRPTGMFTGIGGGENGWYAGELDNVRIWSRAVASEEVPELLRTVVATDGLLLSLDMNQTGAGRNIVVTNHGTSAKTSENTLEHGALTLARSAARYTVRTYGTERTPVFVPRPASSGARLEPVTTEPTEVSTPLNPNRTIERRRTSDPSLE